MSKTTSQHTNTSGNDSLPRVVVISTALSHPRHQRRAGMLVEFGSEVRVYGFGRGLYSENEYDPGIEVVELGGIASGRYLRRLPVLYAAARRIKNCENAARRSSSLVYAFGLDSAVIACLAFGRTLPLIYEVGDIRVSNPSESVFSRLIYELEKRIVRRAAKLVLTAPAFLEQYFSKMYSNVTSKTVIIENKLPAEYAKAIARPQAFIPHTPIRLGLIGVLRFSESVLPLIDAVCSYGPRYELHIFGDGPLREEIVRRADQADNIFYHGPFKNPDDLAGIYSSIDINYVVYDNRQPNVRMALPNKLYESIFFGKPIVVAAKTELAKRVEEHGLGFVIDPSQPGFAGKFLNDLTNRSLESIGARILALPESLAVQDEFAVVSKMLAGVLGI